MSENRLGPFLRARRSRLRPEESGIPSHGPRRVPGLRREEVAVLAGVNVDYYARLEQGRERHPSARVVDALGRALRLDADARDHLHRLAGTAPGPRSTPPADSVPPALRRLLHGFAGAPAFVIDRTLEILAANPLAEALHAPFRRPDNLARMVFLDPVARHFHVRWSLTARVVVGHLRQAEGIDPDCPRLRALVATLAGRSAEFAALWGAHIVRDKSRTDKELHHPEVGRLSFTSLTFDVRDAPGRQLVVYQAEPDGPTARALALLGSSHATPHHAGA
ncbi:helix-turn-helix transcriptional regulator [Streptomyces zhaozhouensis]|nr:helix-turn-helix transcriptional regulator [Streptomyces zhaozhouensis]